MAYPHWHRGFLLLHCLYRIFEATHQEHKAGRCSQVSFDPSLVEPLESAVSRDCSGQRKKGCLDIIRHQRQLVPSLGINIWKDYPIDERPRNERRPSEMEFVIFRLAA